MSNGYVAVSAMHDAAADRTYVDANDKFDLSGPPPMLTSARRSALQENESLNAEACVARVGIEGIFLRRRLASRSSSIIIIISSNNDNNEFLPLLKQNIITVCHDNHRIESQNLPVLHWKYVNIVYFKYDDSIDNAPLVGFP